jgi:two-component system, sensor histidine kinase YesM
MRKGKRLWTYISDYKLQSIFFKNFLISISLIIIPLIIILTIAISSTNRVVRNEMVNLIKNNLSNTSNMLDVIFQDTNYIAGSLSLDYEVRKYLYTQSIDPISKEMNTRNLISSLSSLVARNTPIHSIYIFSELNSEVVTMSGPIKMPQFEDTNWMETYKDSHDGQPIIFSRNMFKFTNTGFDDSPNVITILKPIFRLGKTVAHGAIVINIEHEKLTNHILENEAVGEIFILHDGGEILYSKDRQQINMNINEIENIPSFANLPQRSRIEYQFTNDQIVAVKYSTQNGLTYMLSLPLTHFNTQQKQLKNLSITLILISLIVAFISSLIWSWNSYLPIKNLLTILENPGSTKTNAKNKNEIKYIANNIIRNLNSNTSLKSELKSQLELLDHTRTAALQAQINPHFLYNTLDSIRWSAIGLIGKENKVSRMISDLAGLLRLSLETDDNIISVHNEIKHADLFIRILKARYPRKIKVIWDVDKKISSYAILKLCLQPIIENAYYHGIKPTRKSGVIQISGKKEKETLCIKIADDGQGISPEKLALMNTELCKSNTLKEDHIGIMNVHQRIQLVFGEEYGVRIDSTEGQGTTISLVFPLQILHS